MKTFIKKTIFILMKLPLNLKYQLGLLYNNKKQIVGLNLGSGGTTYRNFINIDVDVFARNSVISNIGKLKFRDNSVLHIYNSHVLEHIPYKDTMSYLKEWHRVLTPKGQIIICVPDFEKLIKIYLENLANYSNIKCKKTTDLAKGVIFGGQTNKFDFHYNGFSFTTIAQMLTDVGFQNVKLLEHTVNNGDASNATIDGELISLNIVATK